MRHHAILYGYYWPRTIYPQLSWRDKRRCSLLRGRAMSRLRYYSQPASWLWNLGRYDSYGLKNNRFS